MWLFTTWYSVSLGQSNGDVFNSSGEVNYIIIYIIVYFLVDAAEFLWNAGYGEVGDMYGIEGGTNWRLE